MFQDNDEDVTLVDTVKAKEVESNEEKVESKDSHDEAALVPTQFGKRIKKHLANYLLRTRY